MFDVRCRYTFEAARRLTRLPAKHPCARLHGHSFVVEITVTRAVDPDTGWAVDFADIDRVCQPLIESLDHQELNQLPGFENPTSEFIASWLWEKVAPRLDGLSEIVIAETERTRIAYRGPQ